MNDSDHDSHILKISNTLGSSRQSYDTILATILFTCTAIGLPGNILALKYFLIRSKTDIAGKLYVKICSVDIVTTLAHIPTTVSLLYGRDPKLFNYMWICATWAIFFLFQQKVSMFLVLLLSVSRTIALAVPFFKLNKRAVFISFVLYVCFELLHESLQFLWNDFKYIPIGPFCTGKAGQGVWAQVVSPVITALQIGLPPILTFISFIVCLVKLRTDSESDDYSKKSHKRATITIAYFTALFLACNLLYFAMRVIVIVHNILGWKLPGPIFSPPFLHEYHLPISKTLCTVLNATLNPVLYWLRMTSFRRWLTGIKDDVISSTSKVAAPSPGNTKRHLVSSPGLNNYRLASPGVNNHGLHEENV